MQEEEDGRKKMGYCILGKLHEGKKKFLKITKNQMFFGL